jgi:hypothetical protein
MSVPIAYDRFLKETIRFLLTQNILLRTVLIAKAVGGDFQARYQDLQKEVEPEYKSPYAYVSAQLFVAYVASFEVFLQDVIASIVRAYPRKIGSTQFRLNEILDTENIDELVSKAIDENLNKIMYKKPLEYCAEVCELLSIDQNVVITEWPHFIEAKARRDLGVHAKWTCNDTYLRKLREANIKTELKIGDLVVPDDEYLKHLGEVLRILANNIVQAITEKHGDA